VKISSSHRYGLACGALVSECERQPSQSGKTNLIDPTSLNITDQSVNAPDGIPVPETNNSTGGQAVLSVYVTFQRCFFSSR